MLIVVPGRHGGQAVATLEGRGEEDAGFHSFE
jgi:hypothetical protein